jgi:hypothetical protein
MSYKNWFNNHAIKHKKIVDRLIVLGKTKDGNREFKQNLSLTKIGAELEKVNSENNGHNNKPSFNTLNK